MYDIYLKQATGILAHFFMILSIFHLKFILRHNSAYVFPIFSSQSKHVHNSMYIHDVQNTVAHAYAYACTNL